MSPTIRRALAATALLLTAACSSNDSTTGVNGGVTVSDLAGTWTATSLVFTSVANPSTSLDAIAGGATFVMQIASSGSYTVTTTTPGQSPDVSTGTITLNGSNIHLAEPTDTIVGTYTLNGNHLTLHLTSGINFDFSGSGDEPATIDGSLTRS